MSITYQGLTLEPWLYRPDGAILERLEWLTDVITSFDGSEQRIALRTYPRRYFEWATVLTERERRTAENLLHNWQARAFGIPVWMESQSLTAPVVSGADTIAIDTTTRDFRVGGILGIATGPHTFEIAQVDAIADDLVTLAAPMQGDWPIGAEIFPMRAARLPEDVRLQRFDGDTSYGMLRWQVIEDSGWPAATGGTTYRSHPVLTQAPNWTEDVEQGLARKLASLDPGTGPAFWDEEGSGAMMSQTHRWLLDGRTQIDAFRRWLYARRGRLSSFWLPTFAQDFKVVASIGSTASTIDVEHCGYTDTIGQDIGRRDIRIELHSGTSYLRRITGCSEVSGTIERISIDSALGALVTPADIRSVNYLDLVRLEADSAEIAWSRWDLAESRLMTRGSRNDI
jgi:hypothetical protein